MDAQLSIPAADPMPPPPPPEALPSVAPSPLAKPISFRPAPLLTAREMRRLRQRQAEFARAAADQLTLLLRMDFQLQAKDVQPLAFEKWAAQTSAPTCLTLFRLEPLDGVCLAELPPRLGLALVDRLMGGTGQTIAAERELSEIEAALLDQAMQVLLEQWRHCWSDLRELRPVLAGRESDALYLTGFAPGTTLVTLTFEVRFGGDSGLMKLAIPFATLEPILRQLPAPPMTAPPNGATPAPGAGSVLNWHPVFDTVPLAVTTSLDHMVMTARQIADLKPGDWVRLPPTFASQARVRVGGKLLFHGRLGTREGRWAVELTRTANE